MWLSVNDVHEKIRLCFPLSRVYFVSCLTGSTTCLCAFAGVVRVSQIELASNFYTSCHEKTERSFPLSVGYSLIAVTSIQVSSRLQSFTSLLRTIRKLFANVLQGVRFKLFNAFVSAIIGSPTLPHVCLCFVGCFHSNHFPSNAEL